MGILTVSPFTTFPSQIILSASKILQPIVAKLTANAKLLIKVKKIQMSLKNILILAEFIWNSMNFIQFYHSTSLMQP